MAIVRDGGSGRDGLWVVDDGYAALSEVLRAFGDAAEGKLEEYLGIMADVCEGAVMEGQVADNLRLFLGSAMSLRGLFNSIGEDASGDATTYVEDIDAADVAIY
jgi:hypothetical protein